MRELHQGFQVLLKIYYNRIICNGHLKIVEKYLMAKQKGKNSQKPKYQMCALHEDSKSVFSKYYNTIISNGLFKVVDQY